MLRDSKTGVWATDFVVLCAMWLASIPAYGLNLNCEHGDVDQLVVFDSPTQRSVIKFEAAEGALIEVEELDLDLRVELNEVSMPLNSEAPPRFGRGFFGISQSPGTLVLARLVPNQAQGAARVKLHCQPAVTLTLFASWMDSLGKISQGAAPGSISSADADVSIGQLEKLISMAPNSWARAQAIHWQAQLLLLSGQTALAMPAFESAAKAWNSASDSARASAARVAFVEDLQRLGRAQEVWEHTVGVVVDTRSDYYTIRLKHAHCLANRYLARYTDAERCFRSVATAFDAKDERAEWVSVIQNHAELKHLVGDNKSAESLAASALSQIAGPDAAMLRGRIQSLRANIAESRAQFPEALSLLHQAIIDFRTAGWQRWEGNMYLKVASLHLELGAIPEANAAVEQALQRFTLDSAPARVASALVVRARIAEVQHQQLLARFWLVLAKKLYQHLRLPLELDGVSASMTALDLAQGRTDAAKRGLRSRSPDVTYYDDRWTLAEAELTSLTGDHAQASNLLDRVEVDSLPLRMRIEHALSSARNAERSEDIDGAVATLEQLSTTIETAAANAANPLLRYLLAKRLEQLDGELVATQWRRSAQSTADPQLLPLIWPMLERRSTLMDLAEVRFDASSPDDSLDQVIAAELLLGQRKSAQATTALLDLLTRHRLASGSRRHREAPGEIGNRLAPGTVMLSHVDLGERGFLIWITTNRQLITETPAGSALQSLADNLLNALGSPTTPIREIEQRAAALSTALLAGAANVHVPKRLLVDRDSLLAGVPWSVLPWRNGGAPLVETTAVSIAPLFAKHTMTPGRFDQIDVFVAANDDSGAEGRLQALPLASVESARIQGIAAKHQASARLFYPSPREDFLASLQRPNTIHVAAHGLADSGAIGYSGLWLNDTEGQTPAFVGWTEPMMSGVRSRLIVLNACSLARSHPSAESSMSFALALHRAGAEDIVAALWPTSDSATAVWVPAFYDALLKNTAGVDQAVVAAISALRRTPMYRHPFYWGSLVQLGALTTDSIPNPSTPIRSADSKKG